MNNRGDAATTGRRKPYKDRALKTRTVSKFKSAGTRKTKKRARK